MNSSSKLRILIVDNDPVMRLLVRETLSDDIYIIDEAESGLEALTAIGKQIPDLVLLDVRMPEMSGLEVCLEIRKRYGNSIPIIMLTGLDDVSDKVNGLDIGADDYITKPFDVEELLARIQSVLRRAQAGKGKPVTLNKSKIFFAGWLLNTINKTLTSPEGKPVDITSSEYQMLEALTKHQNTMLTRDDILAMISGREWSPLDRSADMAISKLRKKIEKDPKNPELIKTVRNKGYQLTATIEFGKIQQPEI